MTANLHKCTNCGYLLEVADQSLCFSCLIADAKGKMCIALAPRQPLSSISTEKEATDKSKHLTKTDKDSKEKKARNLKKNARSKNTNSKVHLASVDGQLGGKISAKRATLLKCQFCKKSIREGKMLAHVRTAHEGKLPKPATSRSSPKALWVTFVSGGLPGLGKRQ